MLTQHSALTVLAEAQATQNSTADWEEQLLGSAPTRQLTGEEGDVA